jgi:predicted ATP-dependent protease
MTTELTNHEAYKEYQKLRYHKLDIPINILEKTKIYRNEQHLLNKEKHKERCKNNYLKNHEAELEKRTNLRQNEEYKLMMKNYRASEAGKKSARISCWKQKGVIHNDYDELYNIWKTTTNCFDCDIELIEGVGVVNGLTGSNKKVLDHDHKTGLFRNIICNRCNVIRGINDKK